MELFRKLILFAIAIFIFSLLAVFILKTEERHEARKENPLTIIKKENVTAPTVTAESALVKIVSKDGKIEQNLFEKNYREPRYIASITKLMTALVAEENLDKNKKIEIEQKIISDGGSSGTFLANENWDYDSLLHLMLIASNNDAAETIASEVNEKSFVSLMNGKAFELGMKDTYFINPSGLEQSEINTSNTEDLAKLILYIEKNNSEILEVTRTKEYTARNNNKSISATSTNVLLSDGAFPFPILGGKTGETPKAKKNLILLAETLDKKAYIVFVVLKSEDNFRDVRELAGWVKSDFEVK